MLCPLSALDPGQGPYILIAFRDLEPIASEMASEIISYGGTSLSLEKLASILSDALSLTRPAAERNYSSAVKLPDGISNWGLGQRDNSVLGIGYFDRLGHVDPVSVDGRYRSGLGLETKLLDDFHGGGHFSSFFFEDEDGRRDYQSRFTVCSSARCWPFFVLRNCFEYLRVWLDPHLPPRIAFMNTAPTMSLEGELYEIINTRTEGRGKRSNGMPNYTRN